MGDTESSKINHDNHLLLVCSNPSFTVTIVAVCPTPLLPRVADVVCYCLMCSRRHSFRRINHSSDFPTSF